MSEVVIIPAEMSVPEERRNTTDPHNVRWLLRNLAIQNNHHPEINSVMEELTILRRWQDAELESIGHLRISIADALNDATVSVKANDNPDTRVVLNRVLKMSERLFRTKGWKIGNKT